ncbi:hypothetical protein F9C07_2287005 [Aspergillus flavus]|uniref:Oryzines biosynthesis cluster protein J n=12 Tax=Aspergillus subgen. Circumdati TaxID=2720871 RepID=ORYJ_ASPOR|nr:uncharacterized protein G4B84_012142 [Aspergillus flavus NRRL3357]Q2TXF5.2 RecName: Full=Oryzines biosynthesis cluster protein J [Aspergillus oryzae RIB40]KAB8207790.1 hypothetical protein BDV34DRAFT_191708 [Aspergillus parasiticus]KAB8226700.1 hypothetical protein BDV33DRAFT_162624 [Aspergillus novoparasiticus]KAB8249622.1 hypothetical protein BDV35DRAFT_344281 [Aspergillus flavus]KAB8272495.1 hypothetical protein BDV30DRAFT_212111 [Aspergillus minisclerotigenes]KAE8313949.1 hypothetical 
MGSLPEKDFPQVHRFITTHKEDGTPTFETKIPEPIEWERTNIGVDFFLAYTLGSFPAPLSHDADLNQYKDHLVNHPPFMIPGGAVVRYVDYHPGCEPMWHRTVTVDFGVVIEGELELEVEGGEKRLMKRGDVAVQRGTNHCWRNPSKTQFARALYIALDAKPVIVNGQELGESLGEVKH